MNQPSLFDAPTETLPVRNSDPVTARVAAKGLNLKARKAEVMDAIGFLIYADDAPFTADELLPLLRIKRPDYERGWVSSRLSQLASDGLIRGCGVHQGRYGKPVMSMTLTDAGREYLRDRSAA